MMDIRQFVAAEVAKNIVTGAVAPPAAGATVVADGAGGAAWTAPDPSLPAGVVMVADQAQPLAPAGQRDLWQIPVGLGFEGSILQYSATANLTRIHSYSGSITANGAQVSADGGLTWAPVIFDVAPAAPIAIGFDGVSLWVGLPLYSSGDFAYTSTDGLNFTAGIVAQAGCQSTNIIWSARLGLFIAGQSGDAAHWISTSPDGVTWTPRVTPSFAGLLNYTQLAQNDDIIVLVGDSNTSAVWSVDGVTWTASASLSVGPSGITWSPERAEFLAIADPSGAGFTSSDGVVWMARGTLVAHVGVVAITWVAYGINRYYVAVSNGANYSLWSSPAGDVAFVPTELDGAIPAAQPYGHVLYLPTFDRFILNLDAPYGIAYSTARPYDIKALSDNIRVRGAPVTVDLYSNTASVNVDNTAVETSLTPSSNSVGSMVLQAPQPAGMCMEFMFFLEVSSVAGDNLTLTIKNQAVPLYSDTLTIPALSNKRPICVRASMTVRAALAVTNATTLSGTASSALIGSNVYDPAIQNTLDVTAQWGAAASTCEMSQMLVTAHFRNGA